MAVKMQLNIYDKQTTYTNDYKYPKVGSHAQYVWPRVEEPRAEPPSRVLVRDNETLTTRPSPITPQGLPCTRVNLEPGVRPHEVMSPAVSLEETDPTARGLLVQHTYTTTTGQAGREGALPVSPQQVSARTLETHADPARFRHVSKSLPPGWSYAANSWDRIQSRFLGDPTRAFWLDNAPRVRCPCVDPAEDLVDEVTRREIHRLLCADRLRLPYDKTAPGYCGYRPEWPVGVPMERRLFPPADPRLSSSQAIAAARYEEARHCDSAQPKQAHKVE